MVGLPDKKFNCKKKNAISKFIIGWLVCLTRCLVGHFLAITVDTAFSIYCILYCHCFCDVFWFLMYIHVCIWNCICIFVYLYLHLYCYWHFEGGDTRLVPNQAVGSSLSFPQVFVATPTPRPSNPTSQGHHALLTKIQKKIRKKSIKKSGRKTKNSEKIQSRYWLPHPSNPTKGIVL